MLTLLHSFHGMGVGNVQLYCLVSRTRPVLMCLRRKAFPAASQVDVLLDARLVTGGISADLAGVLVEGEVHDAGRVSSQLRHLAARGRLPDQRRPPAPAGDGQREDRTVRHLQAGVTYPCFLSQTGRAC